MAPGKLAKGEALSRMGVPIASDLLLPAVGSGVDKADGSVLLDGGGERGEPGRLLETLLLLLSSSTRI